MSLTLNMVGGGGGGLKATDALLRVQAPAGSTVTITKGTTTKTDLGHENADDHTVYDYYFIIHQSQFDSVNPWTVTAVTLDSLTLTDTVIIDAADEYDVIMGEPLYIFKEGDGFLEEYYTAQESNGRISISVSSVGVSRTADYGYQTTIRSKNKIDLTPYKSLKIEATTGNLSTETYRARICYANSAFSGDSSSAQLVAFQLLTAATRGIFSLDISNAVGEFYVGMIGAWTGNLYNMWLE